MPAWWRRDSHALLGFWLLFAAAHLALVWPALDWPMVYDDLHLIRRFSGSELLAVFHAQWDVDNIEIPGLRPFTVLFNHLRYVAFGESVVMQRLLLVALLATYLTCLAAALRMLGSRPGVAAIAGLLCLVSRHSVYHYVWLTDGVHLAQGLMVFAGAAALLRWLSRGGAVTAGLCVILLASSLLIREDSLAAFPAVFILGFFRVKRGDDKGGVQRLVSIVATVALVTLGVFVWRRWAVPNAPAVGINLVSLGRAMYASIHPLGFHSFDAVSRVMVGFWRAVPIILALAMLLVKGARWRPCAVWLGCGLAACSPALTIWRVNLLLFPTTFVSAAYAIALGEMWKAGRAWRSLTAVIVASGLLGGAHVSRVLATNFHPWSARALAWNATFLYGWCAPGGRIPEERRERVRRQLKLVGVRERSDLEVKVPQMFRDARLAGRTRPGPDQVVFLPPIPAGI